MMPPELLSPAGSAEALNAAVRGGADAVYLGLGTFNARRNADNFTPESLREACRYAHLRGTKVFVTLNTVVLPGEVDEALELAGSAYEAGADALIVQDLGIASALADALPGCAVHLSTQANVHDEWGVRAAALVGVSRITLARELSIGEIARLSVLAAELGMQTEAFVHGALCVCYSGQCLMSSLIGSRSANRGLCAQACRLPYELKREGRAVGRQAGEHLLSPKDLCAADLLGDLLRAGVSSFKIEGRMKSPDYVFSATRIYRAALDRALDGAAAQLSPSERRQLESVFSRGFTTAYLEGDRSDGIMSYQRPNNRGTFIGRVESVRDGVALIKCDHPLHPGDAIEFWTGKGRCAMTVPEGAALSGPRASVRLDSRCAQVRASDRVFCVRSASARFTPDALEPKVPVVCAADLEQGRTLSIAFRIAPPEACTDEPAQAIARRLAALPAAPFCAEATGEEVEAARSKELTEQEVCEHVGRVGSTPFAIAAFDVRLQPGIGMGFSQLHKVRARALDRLESDIAAAWPVRERPAIRFDLPPAVSSSCAPLVCVLATNPECARAAKRAHADAVYVPALNYRRGQAAYCGAVAAQPSQTTYPKDCIIQMPAICHDAAGASREAALGADPWEYACAGRPLLVESAAGLVRASALGAIPQAGAGMAITNALALGFAARAGAQAAWLSPELNLAQIAQLAQRSPIPVGVKVAGAQELMVTEHCPLMPCGPCDQQCPSCARRAHRHVLEDRKGFEFPVISDALGRGHIYNSVPLDALRALPQLVEAGVRLLLIDATLMDAEQTAQATGRLVRALSDLAHGGEAPPKLSGATSGHLFRGVV